jgi:putative transposase
MLVRYRYRIDPNAAQRQALARTFGCARVVYNDALRERERARVAGDKLNDTDLQTDLQRRVITLAKQTPERAWLSEVASVALVQACQDARRAYHNWFDSLSGKRKGRRIGHPRLRTSTAASRSGSPATGSRCTAAGCTWPRLASSTCGGRVRCHQSRPA